VGNRRVVELLERENARRRHNSVNWASFKDKDEVLCTCYDKLEGM